MKICIFFATLMLSNYIYGQEAFKVLPGTLKLGIGPTFIGYNGKFGTYLRRDVLISGYFDQQFYLADSKEYGLMVRKYFGKSKVKGFIQPSISYSNYHPWNWSTLPEISDNVRNYKTSKLSGTTGLEYFISKRISIDSEIGYGYYTSMKFGRFIGRASLNFNFGR